MIKFKLPFPPSVNKLYSTSGRRRVKSKKYSEWINEANQCCNQQCIPPMTERCVAIYSFNHPNNSRNRDAENYCKAISDLLVSRGILQDDSRRYLQGTFPHWNDTEGTEVLVSLYPCSEFPFSLS